MKTIIIGGVAAGMSAASKIKRIDTTTEVVVYEEGNFLSYGACGLPYYIGNFNDDYRKMIARTKEQFENVGIKPFLHHKVLSVNPDKKEVKVQNKKTGELFSDYYDKLLVATGAGAIFPPFEGSDKIGVHTLKTLEDGIFLKEFANASNIKNVVIVGGGYIGIECADVFLHLGKNVRLIEASPAILTSFDFEMAEIAKNELEAYKLKIHTSEKVVRFLGDSFVKQVETNQGIYDADLVIVSVGVRPSTSFLQDSGVQLNENGTIVVDRQMRTNIPDIFAAGDCALSYNRLLNENSWLPLGTVANKCGRIAGNNMAGGKEEFAGTLGSAAIKICEKEFFRTGLGEKDLKTKNIPYSKVLVETYDHPSYYPNQKKIVIKLLYNKADKQILGAQLCGENGAVLRGDVFASAIHAGLKTSELGMVDLAYAPPFAGVWDAIQIASNAAK